MHREGIQTREGERDRDKIVNEIGTALLEAHAKSRCLQLPGDDVGAAESQRGTQPTVSSPFGIPLLPLDDRELQDQDEPEAMTEFSLRQQGIIGRPLSRFPLRGKAGAGGFPPRRLHAERQQKALAHIVPRLPPQEGISKRSAEIPLVDPPNCLRRKESFMACGSKEDGFFIAGYLGLRASSGLMETDGIRLARYRGCRPLPCRGLCPCDPAEKLPLDRERPSHGSRDCEGRVCMAQGRRYRSFTIAAQ